MGGKRSVFPFFCDIPLLDVPHHLSNRNAAKARSKDRNGRAQRGHFTRQRLEIFSKNSGKPNPNLPSDKSSAIKIDLAHAQKDILSGRIKYMTQAHTVGSKFLQSSSIPNARTLSSVPADSNHNNYSPRVLQASDTIDCKASLQLLCLVLKDIC